MTFKTNRYGELVQAEVIYTYHIDLYERDSFYTHVENSNGRTIFRMNNETMGIDLDDEGNEVEYTYNGEFWMTEDGFMTHIEDVDGLKSYLVDAGIMKENYTLKFVG